MSIEFHGNAVSIDGINVQFDWQVLTVAEAEGKVFVVLDPDSYLADENYKISLKSGGAAIRNLVGLARDGRKLWEAEFPEARDYYYRIASTRPLRVNSFSSYLCEIDKETGKIVAKEFLK